MGRNQEFQDSQAVSRNEQIARRRLGVPDLVQSRHFSDRANLKPGSFPGYPNRTGMTWDQTMETIANGARHDREEDGRSIFNMRSYTPDYVRTVVAAGPNLVTAIRDIPGTGRPVQAPVQDEAQSKAAQAEAMRRRRINGL